MLKNKSKNNENLINMLSDGDVMPGNELLSNDSNYSPVKPLTLDGSKNATQ